MSEIRKKKLELSIKHVLKNESQDKFIDANLMDPKAWFTDKR